MSYEIEVGRFLNLPLKKTSEINLAQPMEAFIKNNLNKADDDLMRSVREFDLMRKNATAKALDKHDSSLNVLYQYYDQLTSVNKKMPFCEGIGVNVMFTWKNSLEKGKGFLRGGSKMSVANGNFERLCVIYNIAALMTQIGSTSNLKTDDGLKTAAKYFQESAGMFNYIKDHIMSVVGALTVTSDLNPSTLHAFSAIMVAQSQECFYTKAEEMNQKQKILAKVAAQVAIYYKDAANAIGSGEKISLLSTVSEQCQLKKTYYECRAEYHEAKNMVDSGKYGEAVARLKKIEPAMKALLKNQNNSLVGPDLRAFSTQYNAEKQQIEKDNGFIYLDVVPKADALAPIGGAVIAKAKVFNEQEKLSSKFTDMFTTLVPLSVHNAIEIYEGKRKELVAQQIARLRESNNLLNGVMSSLNLPAALEDVNSSKGDLPASITEKSRTVVGKGGVAAIDQLLKDLPDALERNQEILTESLRQLNEEQASDEDLRNKFGAKWTRKASGELTAPLRQEATKYQTIIENAKKADGIVREKYHKHREGIEILGLPEPELKQRVPAAGSLAALKDNPVVVELKMLCEKVETIKAEREVIESELREARFDMTETFLNALSSDGVIDEAPLSQQKLDETYHPLIQQVSESCDSQKNLLANIQRASEQFSVLKQSTSGGNQREEVLKMIAAAYDGFQDLSNHLNEGNKFYKDLTELLLKLQNKCSDLVFARKTERDELMRDLQQGIVAAAPATEPQVPSYQQQARSVPPARPPPPVTTTQPPAPQQSTASAPPPPVPAPRRNVSASNVAQPVSASASAPPAHMRPPYGSAPLPTPVGPPTTAVGPPTSGATAAHQQPPYTGAGYPGASAPYPTYNTPYPPQPYGYQQGYPPQQPYPQQQQQPPPYAGGYPQQQQAYYPGYPPPQQQPYNPQQPYPQQQYGQPPHQNYQGQ